MFEILDTMLERAAARGAADVEVYGERSTSHRIKVYRQEVEQLTAAQRRGVGVRVFSGRRRGPRLHVGPERRRARRRRAARRRPRRRQRSGRVRRAAGAAGEPADVDPFDPRLDAATDEQRIAIALEVGGGGARRRPARQDRRGRDVRGRRRRGLHREYGRRARQLPRRPVLRLRLRARRAGGPGRDRLLVQRRPRARRTSTRPPSGPRRPGAPRDSSAPASAPR